MQCRVGQELDLEGTIDQPAGRIKFNSLAYRGLNFGSGVNYWLKDRVGLRFEFRDNVWAPGRDNPLRRLPHWRYVPLMTEPPSL